MTNRLRSVAAALTLTFATVGQASASDVGFEKSSPHAVEVLAVIGAAYHDARVATNAVEVRAQAGFATAGAVQWLPRTGGSAAVAGGFSVPGAIGAAYHDRRVATSAAEVRRQGGFATAGAVQWLPLLQEDVAVRTAGTTVGQL